MRHIDIKTCEYMSPEWVALIRDGYSTACRAKETPLIAVMWKGAAARDHVRNVQEIPING